MARKATDMTGRVFGELTVVCRAESPSGIGTYWLCRCSCGNEIKADGGNLRRGTPLSCGCANYIDLQGQRFGRLMVMGKAEKPHGIKNRGAWWTCRCDCGIYTDVTGDSLRRGTTRSCGCLQKETARTDSTTHGLSKSPEYKIWNSMIQRCRTDGGDSRYGGRGIEVCARWKNSFEEFYRDMGPRPSENHTLDRRNNDGNYEPGNCRWTSQTVQIINQGISNLNKTGIKGVRVTPSGNYEASLQVHGEVKLRREFKTLEEAAEARRSAEIEFHEPLLKKE